MTSVFPSGDNAAAILVPSWIDKETLMVSEGRTEIATTKRISRAYVQILTFIMLGLGALALFEFSSCWMGFYHLLPSSHVTRAKWYPTIDFSKGILNMTRPTLIFADVAM